MKVRQKNIMKKCDVDECDDDDHDDVPIIFARRLRVGYLHRAHRWCSDGAGPSRSSCGGSLLCSDQKEEGSDHQ